MEGSRLLRQQWSVPGLCSLCVPLCHSQVTWDLSYAFWPNKSKLQVKFILGHCHSRAKVDVGEKGEGETGNRAPGYRGEHVLKSRLPFTCKQKRIDICVSLRAWPPPASRCTHLADELGYPQGSVNLFQAIEVP